MAINVLTEAPDVIGSALAPADAVCIEQIVRHHRDRIAEHETEIGRLRAAFRANMLRYAPRNKGDLDDEINRVLNNL